MNLTTPPVRYITYETWKFVIKYENHDHIIYNNDGIQYPWLDKLNCRSMLNKYSYEKLSQLLVKACEKYYKINVLTDPIPDNNGSSKSLLLKPGALSLDLDCSKEANRIKQLAYEKIRKVPYEVADVAITKLFDRKQCADIIVTDYMKIYREMLSGSKKIMGSINLIDGSIYCWRLELNCFNQRLTADLKMIPQSTANPSTTNSGCVTIELKFHPDYHPNYPPVVTIISPRFKTNLNIRITRSKYTKLEYWNFSRTAYDIVLRTIKLLNQHGEIDHDHEQVNVLKYSVNTQKLLNDFETLLHGMSSMIEMNEDDLIDRDQKFTKVIDSFSKKKKKSVHKDPGIGYGYDGASVWDPAEYERILKERDIKFTHAINNMIIVINKIMDLENGNISSTTQMLKNSQLFKYFIQQFKNVSILEIANNSTYYRVMFVLIQLYCLDTTIDIFHDEDQEKSMFYCIQNLYEKAKTCMEIDAENENAIIITNIYNMIIDSYAKYVVELEENKKMLVHTIVTKKHIRLDHPNNNNNVTTDQCTGISQYSHIMNQYKYRMSTGLHNDPTYHYIKRAKDDDGKNMSSCYKRMSSEIPALIESSISEHAIVLIYVDKQRPNCIRYLISGPPETPYAGGLFIFDSYCGQQYPANAPEFHFVNNGGFRFNPNLYADGKVCLSLLGTYIGPEPNESEKWNAKRSTLSQVVVSLQSQILTDQPYFNEPGYEKNKGTARGIEANRQYNESIQKATMKISIIDMIKYINTYPQFNNAIITHFYLQKEKIINQCNKWVKDCRDQTLKQPMILLLDEMKGLFMELKMPCIDNKEHSNRIKN
jgi:ubiquitin-protein ligase